MKAVPALVCDVCGEEYFDEETTAELIAEARRAAVEGQELVIRTYQATATL